MGKLEIAINLLEARGALTRSINGRVLFESRSGLDLVFDVLP